MAGEIVAIVGAPEAVAQVVVIKPDGTKVPVKPGDSILEGDQIQVPAGVTVEVKGPNGETFEVAAGTVTVTAAMLAGTEGAESTDEAAVDEATADTIVQVVKQGENIDNEDTDVQTVIQAVAEGEDIGEVLEEAAAGEEGGEESEGSGGFFEILRTLEEGGSPVSFNFDTPTTPPVGEEQFSLPEEPVVEPPVVEPPVLDTTPPDTPDSFIGFDDVAPVVGNIVPGGSTNDNLPEIKGTGETPGDIVRVYDNGTPLGTTPVQPDGSWSFTPGTPLVDGPHSITVTAEDPSGNESPQSNPLPFTVDTTPPNAADISGQLPETVKDDTGVSQTDNLTKNQAPTLTGTTELPTDTVVITIAGKSYTATVSDNGAGKGAWTVDLVGAGLADGVYTPSITVTDLAGNTTTKASETFTVDNTPPTTPSGFVGYDDIAPVVGNIVPNGSTNDNLPEIQGTGGEPGNTIEVFDNGTPLGTTTVQPDGSWTFTPGTPLVDGPHSITVTEEDPAGNVSPPSAPLPFTVDTVAPGAPVITSVFDDVGTITGEIADNTTGDPANNTVTDDASPDISGTAEANSTVSIYNGSTLLGTTTADGSGNWTFTPGVTTGSGALSTGAYTITATATDAAGNVSTDSNARNFSVDAGAPADPAITGVDDNVVAIVGNVAPGGVTNDDTPTIIGTGTPGSTVNVYHTPAGGAEVLLGTALVGTDTNWSFTPSPALTDATYNITVDATSPAGVLSNRSGTYSFTVDTVAPNAPAFTLTDDVDPQTGAINGGDTTDDATPTVNGTGASEVGNTIIIYDNNVEIGTAIVQAGGVWTFTPTTPLSDGLHSFTTTETDQAGNVSTPAGPTAFTVDTSGVTVPTITSVEDDFAPQTGVVVKDGFTNDTTPTINGTAPADAATVNVFIDGVQVATGVPVVAGAWTYTVPAGSALTTDGVHTFTATAVETGTGVVSAPSAPYAINLDTVAPNAPVIVDISDDVGSVQGTVANGNDTNDTTPTISGTAEAGTTLTLFDGTTVVGTTTVASNGTWTITTSELLEGIHNFTATTTDAAGNVSPVSNLYGINIDISGPTGVAGVLPETLVDDTGASQTDNLTNNQTPTLTGTTESPTDTVVVTINGQSYTATVTDDGAGNGVWTVDVTNSLPDATYTPSITSTDVAGNFTTVNGETFTVDSTPPTTPSGFVGEDDVAPVIGNIVPNSSTNDNLPEIKGTGGTLGDIIEVSDNGTPLGTTTVQPDGSWTFTPSTPLADGPHSITVTAEDPAGNVSPPSSALPFIVDTQAPNAPTFIGMDDVDPITGQIVGGSIIDDNLPEIIGSGGETGNTIEIFDGSTSLGTTTVQGDGSWTFTPSTPLADGPRSITVTEEDPAGNVSPPSAPLQFTIDTGAPATAISIDANVAGDGVVNATEAASSAVPVTGTVGGDAKLGDTVTVTINNVDYNTPVITRPDGKLGFAVDVQGSDLVGDADSTVEASITLTDTAGNTSTASDTQLYTVNTAPPSVSINLDANVAGDGIVNAAEATAPAIPVTGTVNGTFNVGDIVTITVNGKDFTGGVQAGGTFSIDVPGADLAADGDKTVDASVTTTDSTGNTNTATDTQAYALDTDGPVVFIAIDANFGGDGIINIAESQAGVLIPVTGTVSGEAEVGDPVVVTVNGQDYNTTVVDDGSGNLIFSVDVLGSELALDTTIEATVTATDGAGNSLTALDTLGYVVDLTPPAPTIALDATVAGDGIINLAESQGIIAVTGTVAGDAVEGDAVVVTVNGTDYNTTVVALSPTQLGYSVDVAGSELATDPNVTATVTSTDTAGNTATASTSITYVVDTTPPNAPTFVGIDDVGAVTGPIADNSIIDDQQPDFNGSGGEPGNTITIYDNGVLLGTTTVQAGGVWTFTPSTPLPEGTHNITATETDPAGNVSQPGALTFTLDTQGASAEISIDANVAGDGIVNADEQTQANVPVTGTVGGDAKLGDPIVVTVNGNPYNTTVTDIGGGELGFAVNVSGADLAADADKIVDAQLTVTNAAGNPVVVTDTQAYTLDGGASATISIDANVAGDGIVQLAEAGTNVPVTGTVGGDAKAGDTVTVNIGFNSYTATVVDNGGELVFTASVPANVLANLPTQQVSATITVTDAAGNTATASDTQAYLVEGTPTGTDLPLIALDANIAGDGVINAVESTGPVAVTGTVSGIAKVGDAVEVTVNGIRYATTVAADLTYTVNVLGTQLVADPNVTAKVTSTDGAGDLVSANTSFTYGVDTTPPLPSIALDANIATDGIINLAESQGNIAVTGTVAGDAKVGDVVTVTVPGIATPYTTNVIALAGGQLGFTVDVSGAALAADPNVTATVTTTDAAGNVGTGTTAASYGVDLSPPSITVNVSEEGLTGGDPDAVGNPDTTDSAVATGTINVGTGNTVTLTAPTESLTSGGVTVTWTGSGTNTLVGSAGGVEVIRATIDNDGNYNVTLSKAVDHAVAGEEDVMSLGIGVVSTDAANVPNTGTLTVNIEDDSPEVLAEQFVSTSGAVLNTNLMFTIDLSTSMNTTDGLNGASRLQSTIDSINTLLDRYEAVGDVRVMLSSFSGRGSSDFTNAQLTNGWVSLSEARAVLAALRDTPASGNGTDYDEAVRSAEIGFNTDGKLDTGGTVNAQNIAYLFTDGDPNSVEQSLNTPEEVAAWETFLDNNNINMYALGIGSGVTQDNVTNNMNQLAYNGITSTDTDATLVQSFADLDDVLSATVPPVTGTLIDSSFAGFGADGAGYVGSISIDGTTYTYDGVGSITITGTNNSTFDPVTHVLTITTAGGELALDMDTGDYSYRPIQGAQNPVFTFTLIDSDGDSATGNAEFGVPLAEAASAAVEATIYVTQSNGDVGVLNTNNGVITNISTGGTAFTDVAVDPTNGTLYATTGSALYTVNTNGDKTLIGNTGYSATNSLAISDTGVIYGISTNTAVLFVMDKTTGAATSVLDATGNPVIAGTAGTSPGDLVYQNGALYITSTTAGQVLKYDLTTQSLSTISIPGLPGNIVGLAAAQDGQVYGTTAAGDVYKIDFETDVPNTGSFVDTGVFVTEGNISGLASSLAIATVEGDISKAQNAVVTGVAAGTVDSASGGVGTTIDGIYGTLVVAADGKYTYTLDTTRSVTEVLVEGEVQTDVFTFTNVNDAGTKTETAQLTIEIAGNSLTSFVGGAGVDNHTGTTANEYIDGAAGDDVLDGGAGVDRIIGGAGNDNLTGGTGADVFEFNLADNGAPGTPAVDTITDFNTSTDTSINGQGDVLDLRDLLVGEENADNLANFLHFEEVGANTVVHVSSTGQFDPANYDPSVETQTIVLENVSMADLGAGNDQAIIQAMLDNNKLVIDQ